MVGANLFNNKRFNNLTVEERIKALSVVDPLLVDEVRRMQRKLDKYGPGFFHNKGKLISVGGPLTNEVRQQTNKYVGYKGVDKKYKLGLETEATKRKFLVEKVSRDT